MKQFELFNSSEKKGNSQQLTATKSASKPFVPPHLNVLSPQDARKNAVYVLRIQLGNTLKKLGNGASVADKHTFLSLLAAELKIKKGLSDAVIAGRSAIMITNANK